MAAQLFAEKFWLRCRPGDRFPWRAPRDADNPEDLHLFECRARNEHAQTIAVQVRWRQLHACIEQVEQVVCNDPLHHIGVSKFQPHPQTIQFGSTEKRLTLRLKGLEKLADKIDTLYIAKAH